MTAPRTESLSAPTCAESGLCTDRRTLLRGAAALGAVGLLAACGGGDDSDSAEQPAPPAGSDTGNSTPAGTDTGSTPTPTTDSAASGGEVLGPAADVPVGGGKVFNDKIVVTQPTAGEYKAFSAACTHSGCTVSDVKDGTINCACHGSKFSDKDGSVTRGPAMRPLEAKTVTVEDGNLTLA